MAAGRGVAGFVGHASGAPSRWQAARLAPMEAATKQLWVCTSCGFVDDPAEGDPDGGVPPGTAFDDIPKDGSARSAARVRATSSPTSRAALNATA